MCTLSYIPYKNNAIFTSNRDEDIRRGVALPPKMYEVNGKEITFPKDEKSGGSWFACKGNEAIMILLNGAKEKHVRRSRYRRSRGLILLDLLSQDHVKLAWEAIGLNDIEPFTIVFYDRSNLYQWRWNGEDKKEMLLDVSKSYIWSSSTLYSKEARELRQELFINFMKEDFSGAESVFNFQKFGKIDDKENGFQINRNGIMMTQTICQSIVTTDEITMRHQNLID